MIIRGGFEVQFFLTQQKKNQRRCFAQYFSLNKPLVIFLSLALILYCIPSFGNPTQSFHPNEDAPPSSVSNAHNKDQQRYFLPFGGYLTFLGIAHATPKKEITQSLGIESGTGLHFELGFIFWELLILGIEFGFLVHDDNMRGNITVVDTAGSTSSLESNFFSGYFSPVAGVGSPIFALTKIKTALRFGFDVGYSLLTTRQYYSDYCVDCPDKRHNIDNGGFYQPNLSIGYGKRENDKALLVGLKVGYRRYFGNADFKQMLLFLFDIRFSGRK